MALNEQEYQLLTFIEQEYMLSGMIPTKEICMERLPWLTPNKYTRLYKREDFRNALQSRGIQIDVESNGVVTGQQLAIINILLDQNDTRSDKKKLADAGIATATFQGWQKDPAFRQYWQQRCEALFPDGVNEANRALMDNVKRGDLGSIKLIYEMTGRWSSKPVSEMNIEWVLMKVLETIQKNVTDPLALAAIAEDLTGIQEQAVPRAVSPVSSLNGFALPPGRTTVEEML